MDSVLNLSFTPTKQQACLFKFAKRFAKNSMYLCYLYTPILFSSGCFCAYRYDIVEDSEAEEDSSSAQRLTTRKADCCER